MDLEISNLALSHLIDENQILVNGFINKIQTTNEGFLKLKIHTKQGDKTVLANKKAILISKKSVPAKQNPGGFSSFIKKFIFNQRIISLKQKEFDRIIIMEFPTVFLIFELFSKGNVILCDKKFKIIRAMIREKWKDRELKKDEIYKFPSSRGKNPLKIEKKEFFEELKKNEKSFFGSIIDILNVSPGIINFLFEKNNWDKKIPAKNIDEKLSNNILNEIQKIYSKKCEGGFILDNVIYSININNDKKFDNITDLLNEYFFQKENLPIKKETNKIKSRTKDYSTQIKKFILDEAENQKIGETIYLEYANLQKIIQKILKLKETKNTDNNIEKELQKEFSNYKNIKLEKNKLIIEI